MSIGMSLVAKMLLTMTPGGQTYLQKVLDTQPGFLIQALPLNESSGVVATDYSSRGNDGLYASSGITYGEPGIGDGLTAVKFDGNDTFVDMVNRPGNTLGSDWNGNLYSAISWGRVDGAARWTDDSTFRYVWHIRDGSNATYYTVMGKHTNANTVFWRRRTGGAITERQFTFSGDPPTDWFCMGITCDQSQPVLNFYLYDSVNGWQKLTESTSANLTDWPAENAPTQGTSVLYAGSVTLQEWVGHGAHCYTWSGIMLSDDEMQRVMTL